MRWNMSDIEKIANVANEGNGGSISNIINQAQESTTLSLTDRLLCHSANDNRNSHLMQRKITESLEEDNESE